MPNQFVQSIAVSSIVVPTSARCFHEQHAKKIAQSLEPAQEIFQPIGVIADGDVHRLVWGRHRLGAYKLLSRTTIPARVLPAGTTAEDELKYSLIENNLRRDESPEDMVIRVEELARQLSVSLSEAAKLSGVKPAYFSRWRTAVAKLCPAARKSAQESGLGISDQYLIASKATTPEQQMVAIEMRSKGTSRDELVQWFSQTQPNTTARRLALCLVIDDAKVVLNLPSDADYDAIETLLAQLKKQLRGHKERIPLRLLPQVLQAASKATSCLE